jgi:hypothetical protein
MGSGDLSTDLTLGILSPTSSVGPAEERARPRDAESKARRRPRPADPDADSELSSLEAEDKPAHQIDRLA